MDENNKMAETSTSNQSNGSNYGIIEDPDKKVYTRTEYNSFIEFFILKLYFHWILQYIFLIDGLAFS